MRAAYNGHADIIRVLIAAGADIDVKDHVSKRMFTQTFILCCFILLP